MPWLKEEVLNNCTYKDQKMIAGIAQYIDHLEGIFNIREDKKKMNEELMGHIRKNFNIVGATADDFEKLAECQKLLDTFQTELDNLTQEMIQKNPWNQPAREKSFWLANNLKQFFLEDIQKRAAPFSKVDTWQGSVFVLNNWNHNGYTFAIDIAFGEKTGQDVCVSLALRNKNVPYQTICNEMFATIFNKYEWQYQDNWRFKKIYKEITNDNEKMQFIDNILLLLQDLKAL